MAVPAPHSTAIQPGELPAAPPSRVDLASPAPAVTTAASVAAPRRPRVAASPGWRLMNLVSRSRWLRDAVCSLAQQRARARGYGWDTELEARPRDSLLAPLDAAASATRLANDGFCEGLTLAPQVVGELLSFALLGTCYGDSDPHSGFAYADRLRVEAATGRAWSLATYLFTEEVDTLLTRIADDPQLRAVIAHYFGVPPVFLGRRLWWTLKTPEHLYDHRLATCHFHYDRDDYRSVRVFFHLTAVDAAHGQHVVVRGSHRRKPLAQQLALQQCSDANIERYYGRERVVAIEGAAGTGFIEDTYCYHKATRPIAGDRLMLELGFGLRDHRRYPPLDRADARLVEVPSRA